MLRDIPAEDSTSVLNSGSVLGRKIVTPAEVYCFPKSLRVKYPNKHRSISERIDTYCRGAGRRFTPNQFTSPNSITDANAMKRQSRTRRRRRVGGANCDSLQQSRTIARDVSYGMAWYGKCRFI